MAKTTKKSSSSGGINTLDVLKHFDLADYRKVLKQHAPLQYAAFIKQDHDTQMMTMCHTITQRPDMQNTLAYKKALKWLRDHNTKGRMF